MSRVLLAIFSLLIPIAMPQAAETCAPGPACQNAGITFQRYTNRMEAKLSRSTGTANAAMLNYCVMKAGAELSRLCADEQLALGKRNCAHLAYQQQAAYERNYQTSKEIVLRSAQGLWSESRCEWGAF